MRRFNCYVLIAALLATSGLFACAGNDDNADVRNGTPAPYVDVHSSELHSTDKSQEAQ